MPTWALGNGTLTNQYVQYASGGALDEERGLWQLWVTLDGYHINWVAAYREQARIDRAMQELKQGAETGTMFDLEEVRATLDRIYEAREADPAPLPEVVTVIRRNLRGTGLWKEEGRSR